MKNTILELWSRKSLIRDIALVDLKLRYKNSVLGFFWTFLEPLLLLSVLYLVFTSIFQSQIENFPLYLLLGIIMWNFTVRATTFSVNSIINRAGVVTQIYFPREIFAISSSITSTIMFAFEFLAFLIFMIVLQFLPPITILLFPIIVIMQFVLVLGLSFPLSVLNVYYRDVQFIWGVVVHSGFFLVPIFYTLDMLPENIRQLVMLNPMAQMIEMAHNITLYGTLPSYQDLSYTIGIIIAIFFGGYFIFKKFEKRVVEEL